MTPTIRHRLPFLAGAAAGALAVATLVGAYALGSASSSRPTSLAQPAEQSVSATGKVNVTAKTSEPTATPLSGAGAVAHLPFDTAASFPALGEAHPSLWVSASASGGDGSEQRPFGTIADALAKAGPGDVVLVGPGEYHGAIHSIRAGQAERPIRLIGNGAKLIGDGFDEGRLLEITHDYITLERFELTGADKLVWVQQARGVRILGNTLSGAGGECVRINYMATYNEVGGNTISDCGKVNFTYPAGNHKNGEGIYLGTAPEQTAAKNPTPDPDTTSFNWIHDNTVQTRAECVDIKEAATANLVQANRCTG